VNGRRHRFSGRRLAWLAAAAVLVLALPARAETVTVFAAGSLIDVLQRVAVLHRERSEDEIRFSFAASSTLARQIEQGAPADLFFSAHEDWMDYLQERKLVAPADRLRPIRNTLVLISPSDARRNFAVIDKGFDPLPWLGADGRLAVADPAHVPVGVYARQAFEWLGVWESLEPRLARTQDVRSALVLVERGEAPLGVVFETDARISPRVDVIGRFPAKSHQEIVYSLAIIAGRDRMPTRAVFDLFKGPDAGEIFEAYGFGLRQWPMEGGGNAPPAR
jgi:molybdate transport system substrate-binding protein